CSIAPSTGPQPNGHREDRRYASTSVWKILRICWPILNVDLARWLVLQADARGSPGTRRGKNQGLCSRRSATAAHDELQIAQIHEYAEGLSDDENRILPVKRVPEQHQSTAD